jgi:hypothetical protein
MRIDKMIDKMLKQGPAAPRITVSVDNEIRNMKNSAEIYHYFEGWAWRIVEEFLAHPDVDILATQHHRTTEAAVQELQIDMNLEGPSKDDPTVDGMAGGDGTQIVLTIPWNVFQTGDRASVIEVLHHEFAHIVDQQAGTAGRGTWTLESWLAHPDEQDSMRATIKHMMNMGYSNEEVAALMWAEFYNEIERFADMHQVPREEYRDDFMFVIWRLIEQMSRASDILIER